MFWLYLIIAVALLGFGVYRLGVVDMADHDREGLVWIIGFVAIGWPVVLAGVIVFGPFVGLYALGVRKRNARKAAKEAK